MNDQDPAIVNLTKAIALTESGKDGVPNYSAVGDAGTSKGAYQWQPGNFEAAAKAAGLEPSDFSPANQNKVAYSQVKAYHDRGMNPAQIAAAWNAGEKKALDGSWQKNIGTTTINGKQIAYNTPAYVQKVNSEYRQLAGAGTYNPKPFSNPTAGSNPGLINESGDSSAIPTNQHPGFMQGLNEDLSGTNPESIPTQLGNTIKGVGNFLFPTVGDVYHDLKGDNTKTGLQQLGDLGSSALSAATLIPGVGELALGAKGVLAGAKVAEGVAEGAKAVEGAGAVAKAAPGLMSTISKNAALGAGFGVSGALGQGETDPTKIAESGLLGAGTGGVIGGAAGALSEKLAGAGATAEERLGTQTNRLKTLQKSFADNSRPASVMQGATDPIKTLSQNDLIKGLKVSNGKVDASLLSNPQDTGTLDNLIEDHSTQASNLVKSMKGGVPLDSFKNAVLDAVANNPAIRDAGDLNRAESEVERRFASYSRSFGDLLPFTAVDGIRTAMNRIYDPAERDVARTIGDTARNYLYNGDGANTALKSLMQNEGELIRAKNFIEKLHGTTVPGGRLHKYIAELVGGAVGAAVGKAVPFGDVVSIPAGAYVGGKLEDMAQSRYFNPSGVSGLIQKIGKSKASQAAGGLVKASALRGASSIVR